jgi:hypothetical protein
VTHLQYADDTIIMIQANMLGIANLKIVLLCFENMIGFQINFHKSEVLFLGYLDLGQERIANKLNCKQGKFPFTYLGLPIGDLAITALDWGPVSCKMAKHTNLWLGKLMSSATRR